MPTQLYVGNCILGKKSQGKGLGIENQKHGWKETKGLRDPGWRHKKRVKNAFEIYHGRGEAMGGRRIGINSRPRGERFGTGRKSNAGREFSRFKGGSEETGGGKNRGAFLGNRTLLIAGAQREWFCGR